jgi:hypothetical protein
LKSLGKSVEFKGWFQCQHQIHEPWLSHKGLPLKSWFNSWNVSHWPGVNSNRRFDVLMRQTVNPQ